MKINYDEFIEMIPEETNEYLKIVFAYLNYYLKQDKGLRSTTRSHSFQYYSELGDKSVSKAKMLLSILIGLQLDPNTSSYVCKYGIECSKILVEKNVILLSEQEEKEVFDAYSGLFCFYNDYTKYSTLLPIDIAANALAVTSNEIKNKLFNYLDIEHGIKDGLKQLSIDEHTKQDMKKEITIYQDLPYNTINYIEVASKIRSILIDKLSKNEIRESDYIKNDDVYLAPISLLLAIYEHDGSEKNIIENYLISQNVNLKEIYGKIGVYLSEYDIKNTPRNLEGIELVYKQYWTDGINKGKQVKDIKILDILSNVVNRAFTQSIVIEKILGDYQKNIGNFSEINEKVTLYENLVENSELERDIKNFYSMISKDTREFIVFSCKTYQVLLNKMKLGEHNKEILSSEYDASSLAMYIASHFYKTHIDNFFNSYSVTFEKVMELLNIQIAKDEIEKEILDKAILLDKFKKFVLSGRNINRNTENITINDVSLNLCNRNFNGSMIMENIFEEIRRDLNLPNDFYDMLNKFLNKQEKEISDKKKEEYFKKLPIEDFDYLINVCRVYKGLIKNNVNDKYCDELIVVLSLLAGLNIIDDTKVKSFFMSMGISLVGIYSHFGIPNATHGTLDIELLENKFNKYIYGGRNKGNESPNIRDIALNIFNDEIYKSIELEKFLYKFGLSYDAFKDTNKLIEEYEKRVKEEELLRIQNQKNEDAQRLLNRYTQSTIALINAAVNNYNKLIGIYLNDKERYKQISSEEDIEVLSIILAILDSDISQAKTFIKHGLDKEDILKYLDLPVNYYDYSVISESKNTLANIFIKYIRNNNQIISTLSKNDFYLKIVNRFVKNITIFETEIKTGKNYEETLTIPERIKLIKEFPVEQLDVTNMSNVLNFGSSLGLHAAYIQDEYPKLMKSDEVSKATKEIKKLVDNVYTEREVIEEPKGLLQLLFGAPSENRKEVKINMDVIDSLKPNIEIQVEKLNIEAQKLTELKQYMEEYYKKNKAYIEILSTNLEELKKELAETRNDDIFKVSDLNSYITVLGDKLKTLKLTDSLIIQEYVKLNQVIVNHCITINSLLMSKNTLLPLIGTGIFIGNGINTEKESLDVTKNILILLNDIISQDVVGTREVLEKLKDTSMTEEQLEVLRTSVAEQINQINASRKLQNPNPPVLKDSSYELPVWENNLTTNKKKIKKYY